MSAKKNMDLIRSAYEDGINKGDIEYHADSFAEGYVNHFSGRDLDVEAFKKIFYMFKAGFPDLNTTIEDIFSDPTGEKVAIRHTYRGTHTGTYMGVPPTGKAVQVSANDLYHLKDGQIVEEWSEFDLLGVLQQIGAIPPMPVGP